jgi:hypothetical protein
MSEILIHVDGVNIRYQFELEREWTSPLSIKKMGTSGIRDWVQGSANWGDVKLTDQQLLIYDLIPVLDVENIPIEQFLTSKSLTIEDVRYDDKRRVAVKFTGLVPLLEGNGAMTGGTVWLAPLRFWAVDEYVVEVTNRTAGNVRSLHRIVEWTNVGDCPVPSNVVTTSISPGSNNQRPLIEREMEFSNWQLKTFPLERFRLPHYGMPDPNSFGTNAIGARRLFLWVNLLALLFVALLMCLKYVREGWMARRRAASG